MFFRGLTRWVYEKFKASHQSAFWQAEGPGDKEGNDKLDEVEQPAVEAEHSPVDSFQVPASCQVAHLNTKVGKHRAWMENTLLHDTASTIMR